MRWLSGVSCAPPASRGQRNRCGLGGRTPDSPGPEHPAPVANQGPSPRAMPAPHSCAPALPSPSQLAWLLVQSPVDAVGA